MLKVTEGGLIKAREPGFLTSREPIMASALLFFTRQWVRELCLVLMYREQPNEIRIH